MKSYLKMTACILAVAISAGVTGTCAYTSRKNASAMDTSIVDTNALPAEGTAAESAPAARAAADGSTFKDETVYVLCNSDASPREVIVSDWLKNPQALSTLADTSSLTDIENVKGDEAYNGMSWNAGGADIYYKGKSHSELPVDVTLTYTLDGQKMSADAMKGKSGHLVMEWTYTNKQFETRTVAGKKRQICVPFMAASTAILNNDIFQNVEVTNGRVISDGEKLIVVGMAFPGLSDSLGLDEMKDIDVNVPDHFTIECDVQNFKMDSSVTVVSNEIFSEMDLDKTADLDDLEEKLNKLNDAAGELCDGTQALYDGICELSDGTGDLKDGVQKLYDGAGELQTGAKTLGDGASKLSAGAQTVAGGTNDLYNGIISAKDGSAKLFGGFGQVQDGSKALADGIGSAKDGAAQLDGGLFQVADGSGKLVAGFSQVTDGASQLDEGIASAKDGAKALSDGIAQAADGSTALTEGFAQVREGAKSLDTGIGSAKDGAKGLQDGIAQAADGSQALVEGFAKVNAGTSQLGEGTDAFGKGMETLTAGSAQLKAGSEALATGADQLSAGAGQISENTAALSEGIASAKAGADQLSEGSESLSVPGQRWYRHRRYFPESHHHSQSADPRGTRSRLQAGALAGTRCGRGGAETDHRRTAADRSFPGGGRCAQGRCDGTPDRCGYPPDWHRQSVRRSWCSR